MLSDDEVAKICGAELDAAIALAGSADNGRMQTAIDYSEGALPANDDPEGDQNREAVSLDVADMVEAVYAQIAPSLEDVGGIQFDAVSADDEPDAQKESGIVRAMLMEGYAADGGFVSMSEQIKDALLLRTGVLALWIDRTETREPEEWEDVPELAIPQVIAPSQPGQRIEALDIQPDDDATQDRAERVAARTIDTGQAEAPDATGDLFRIKLVRVNVEKRLSIGCVPRENFVCSGLTERDVNRQRFVADRMVSTKARLVAEGFDKAKVKALKRHDPTSYELHLRRSDGQDQAHAQAAQDATQTVEIWRCHPVLAENADDVEGKRYRVYYSRDSKSILAKPEAVGRVCYAIGNVLLYPHRMDGVSLFDRIGEVQEVKTRALRSWIENAHKVNRPRLAVDESLANLADAKDATSDIIRVKGPNALQPVPSIDAGQSLNALMMFMDKARSERGGAALDMQASATTQIASNQTAQGIERQYSVKEQLAAIMARTFGETALRSAFQIAHYLLRTQWGDMLTVKVDGEWVQVDPSKWRPRNGVRVRIGQSDSQRAKRMVALDAVIAKQVAAMGQGMSGILTDASRIYNAVYDWTTTAMLPGPERYWIDPKSQAAQQAGQKQQQQNAASMQSQADGMRAALMLEKYKVDSKSFTDLVDTLVKAAIEEAKLTLSTLPLQEAGDIAQSGAEAAASQAGASIEAGAPKPPNGGAIPPGM